MSSVVAESTQTQDVQIRRDGHRLSGGAELTVQLGGDFVVRRLKTVTEENAGYCTEHVSESLLVPPDCELRPNAGLLQAIPFIADPRTATCVSHTSLPFAALSRSTTLQESPSEGIRQFVHRNTHGIFRLAKSVDKAAVISQISGGFPNSRIVVIANKKKDLHKIVHGIGKLRKSTAKKDVVPCVTGSSPLEFFNEHDEPIDGFASDSTPFHNLITCTPLQLNDLEPASIDIVIVLNASEVVTSRVRTAICKNDARFRLFGIATAERQPGVYEDAHVSAAFGFSTIDILSNGRIIRPTFVEWIDNHQNRIVSDQPVSHQTIFHNERRNRLIGQIAKGWRRQGIGARKVAIVVDRIDHAIAMGRKLPDWPIVTKKGARFSDLPGSQRRRIARDRANPGRGEVQIVMSNALARANLDVDVIVAAAGGKEPLILASTLARHDRSDEPVLIVDFKDRFNHKTAKSADFRKLAYEKRDIFETGISPQEGRARRFVQKLWRQH